MLGPGFWLVERIEFWRCGVLDRNGDGLDDRGIVVGVILVIAVVRKLVAGFIRLLVTEDRRFGD